MAVGITGITMSGDDDIDYLMKAKTNNQVAGVYLSNDKDGETQNVSESIGLSGDFTGFVWGDVLSILPTDTGKATDGTGLNWNLIGTMSEGYCKDYLSICLEGMTGDLVSSGQDGYESYQRIASTKKFSPLIPITFNVNESDAYTKNGLAFPQATFDMSYALSSDYGTDGTLYNAYYNGSWHNTSHGDTGGEHYFFGFDYPYSGESKYNEQYNVDYSEVNTKPSLFPDIVVTLMETLDKSITELGLPIDGMTESIYAMILSSNWTSSDTVPMLFGANYNCDSLLDHSKIDTDILYSNWTKLWTSLDPTVDYKAWYEHTDNGGTVIAYWLSKGYFLVDCGGNTSQASTANLDKVADFYEAYNFYSGENFDKSQYRAFLDENSGSVYDAATKMGVTLSKQELDKTYGFDGTQGISNFSNNQGGTAGRWALIYFDPSTTVNWYKNAPNGAPFCTSFYYIPAAKLMQVYSRGVWVYTCMCYFADAIPSTDASLVFNKDNSGTGSGSAGGWDGLSAEAQAYINGENWTDGKKGTITLSGECTPQKAQALNIAIHHGLHNCKYDWSGNSFSCDTAVEGEPVNGSGVDCSGFAHIVLEKAGGKNVPRYSQTFKSGTARPDKSKWQTLDAVVGPGHVMVYIGMDSDGDGCVAEAQSTAAGVNIRHVIGTKQKKHNNAQKIDSRYTLYGWLD